MVYRGPNRRRSVPTWTEIQSEDSTVGGDEGYVGVIPKGQGLGITRPPRRPLSDKVPQDTSPTVSRPSPMRSWDARFPLCSEHVPVRVCLYLDCLVPARDVRPRNPGKRSPCLWTTSGATVGTLYARPEARRLYLTRRPVRTDCLKSRLHYPRRVFFRPLYRVNPPLVYLN